ncbi:MAG: amidohydrolase family protein [Armatimonadetes bacterium]|nr:amidohydrolase family protein [Armatimonadota bacterium]
MLIDCHTHLWSQKDHLSAEFLADANRMRSDPVDLDVTPEKHQAAMQGVDRCLVFGLRARHSGVDVPNDFIADYARDYPEKVIGFMGIDPTEGGVEQEIERGLALGLRGIKIGPIYQNYHPMDERAQPMWRLAERHGLPFMIHQGTTFPRVAPLKYANPILLEDVALCYPEVRMVIAHLGHPWEVETLVLIRKQPHLYADVSALWYRPWQLYNSLRLAYEYGVTHKLFFGTDFPVATVEDSIAGLRALPELAERANLPEIPRETIEQILHRDCLTPLGLD